MSENVLPGAMPRPGLRAWLTAEIATSPRQASLQRFYFGWRRLRANPMAMTALAVIGILVVVALLAPLIAPQGYDEQSLAGRLMPPSRANWFGTDELGRSILARLVHGTRITLMIAVLVAVIVAPIGLFVGTTAGYFGGWVDAVLMRVTDIFLSFPSLILALGFVAALGPGIRNAIIAIALTAWPPIARLARAETLTVRNADYIAAVRIQGGSALRIVARHIVPMCLPSVIVRITLNMAGIILTAAGLGFPGPGRAAADAGVGRDAVRRPQPPDRRVVALDGARDRDRHHQPRLQPAGRRAARRARPALAMTGLVVEDLRVRFRTPQRVIEAVRGVSFTVGREKVGIVGESGSGKSMTGRAILRLTPTGADVTAKRLGFDEVDLLASSERQMLRVRGRRIAMIMQDPRHALDPVMRVGEQIAEAIPAERRGRRGENRDRVMAMLEAVQIRDPSRVFDLYPHEVSGGMGQRIMIAMMLMPEPSLLIADEPTSALDVMVRLRVLAILDELVSERNIGLMFISHDLNLVATFCDRVLIMYAGRIVEECAAGELAHARHPYTRGLLASLPRAGDARARLPVLSRDASWLTA